MSTENDLSCVPVELSEQELDLVSGGIDISFSMSTFDEVNVLSSQQPRSERSRSSSMSKSSRKSSSALQFSGTGFNSADEIATVLSGLNQLFD